jgi:hypothetical protein
MKDDKQIVYTTNKPYEVELIKKYLADHDIISFSINKQDSSYHFGEIELYVNREDFLRAKRLISQYNN